MITAPIISTSESSESSKTTTLSVEEFKEQLVQFWLKPENYCHVPIRMAVFLYLHSRISFRHCLYSLQKDDHVSKNFETFCEWVFDKQYPHMFDEKPDDKLWFQYLSEVQYTDESPEMRRQNAVHKMMKRRSEEVLTQMEKIAGGDLRIVEAMTQKRELMAKAPRKGMAIQDPVEWLNWLEMSEEAKNVWNKRFDRALYQNGDFNPKIAKEKAFGKKAKFAGGSRQKAKQIYKGL